MPILPFKDSAFTLISITSIFPFSFSDKERSVNVFVPSGEIPEGF